MFIYIHNLSYYLIFLHQVSEHEVDNITFIQYRTFGISNRIGGVIVSMLTSSVVGRGFEPPSGQTKDNKIGICCFSAKHAALRRKSKDWLARNYNNVSECDDMSIRLGIRIMCPSETTCLYADCCFS